MIYGIGTDIVKISRIENTIKQYGDRFINRIFTEEEKQKAFKRKQQAPTFAKMFAAKEAFIKALGGSFGINWKDMCIQNDTQGKPVITLHSKALEHLNNDLNDLPYAIHLSLSDDTDYAIAYVIIERV